MPGIIESLGAAPATRKFLFLAVCVPLRLAIAFAASKAHERREFRGVVILGSLFAVYTLLKATDTDVWWNRRVHGAHALAVLVLAAVVVKPEYVSHVLLSDVVFGVLTSLAKKPFI